MRERKKGTEAVPFFLLLDYVSTPRKRLYQVYLF